MIFPTISVQQPRANDLVGSQVLIAGLGNGFEGTVRVRIRDGNGQQLAETSVSAGGGAGEIGQFQAGITLAQTPATANGFVEVWDDNAGFPNEGPYGGQVAEINKVIVPVVFGSRLVDGYFGYSLYVVKEGDSLSSIAAAEYGDSNLWPRIFEANRDQIGNPNLIFSGQRLRLPRGGAGTPTTAVEVFFLDEENYATGTEPYLVPVLRNVSGTDVPRRTLDALFAGPTPEEHVNQHLMFVASEATGFSHLSIADGIARVQLAGGCNSGGATFTIASHIIPTLKLFSEIDSVKILDPSGQTANPTDPTDSIPACLEP